MNNTTAIKTARPSDSGNLTTGTIKCNCSFFVGKNVLFESVTLTLLGCSQSTTKFAYKF